MKLLPRSRALRILAGVATSAAVLAAIVAVAPRFERSSTRSQLSRARADMRSLATAIESYYADWNAYPPMMPLSKACSDTRAITAAGGASLTTFAWGAGTSGGLTTPASYVTSYPPDPLHPTRGVPLVYHAVPKGWILVSVGPDGDYDLVPARDYDAAARPFSPALLRLTYDPTNGIVSNGDVWRVKE